MDGFKGHEKSIQTINHLLIEFKVAILFIPPHSSDQVQPLDLVGFNVQKLVSRSFPINPHYTWQTNQIMSILEGLNKIKSSRLIAKAWQAMCVFRSRSDIRPDPDNSFLMYHVVDITQNKHIRGRPLEPVKLNGSSVKRSKYSVLKPDRLFSKKRELKLKTPYTVLRYQYTSSEGHELKNKYLKDDKKKKKSKYKKSQIISNHKKIQYSLSE